MSNALLNADDLEILAWAADVCARAEDIDYAARASDEGTTEVSRGVIPPAPSRDPGQPHGSAELRALVRRLRLEDADSYMRGRQ